jgi:hypothetical protein
VLLIGSEPARPYESPPLTQEYLRGESPREKAYVHEQGFYEQHQIELLTSVTATAIDPGRSRITLDDGRELGYDRRRAPRRGGSRFPARTSMASTTCARSLTATCCASVWTVAVVSWRSALAGSAASSPPARASADWR